MKTPYQKYTNSNITCLYCKKTLTAKSFEGGKWKCENCGKLLTYEKFKEYYEKQKAIITSKGR